MTHMALTRSMSGIPLSTTVRPSLSREEFLRQIQKDGKNPIITIMPGSRENEIMKHMPVLLKTVSSYEKKYPRNGRRSAACGKYRNEHT